MSNYTGELLSRFEKADALPKSLLILWEASQGETPSPLETYAKAAVFQKRNDRAGRVFAGVFVVYCVSGVLMMLHVWGNSYLLLGSTVLFALIGIVSGIDQQSAEVNRLKRFERDLYDLSSALGRDQAFIEQSDFDTLKGCARNVLVWGALRVLQLEAENVGVPEMHWKERHDFLTRHFAWQHKTFRLFQLVEGGYKPFYDAARAQMK